MSMRPGRSSAISKLAGTGTSHIYPLSSSMALRVSPPARMQ